MRKIEKGACCPRAQGQETGTECPPQTPRVVPVLEALQGVRFPVHLDPCSPTRITRPPHRTANLLKKASRVPGKCSNTNASFTILSPVSLGKTVAAPSNQNRAILLRVGHPRLQPIIAFPITVCCTAPPPVSHLPKHLPFRMQTPDLSKQPFLQIYDFLIPLISAVFVFCLLRCRGLF